MVVLARSGLRGWVLLPQVHLYLGSHRFSSFSSDIISFLYQSGAFWRAKLLYSVRVCLDLFFFSRARPSLDLLSSSHLTSSQPDVAWPCLGRAKCPAFGVGFVRYCFLWGKKCGTADVGSKQKGRHLHSLEGRRESHHTHGPVMGWTSDKKLRLRFTAPQARHLPEQKT